jgi:hypothetical protein
VLNLIRTGVVSDDFAEIDRLFNFISDIVGKASSSTASVKTTFTQELLSVLEHNNAKAMADAFRAEDAFSMPPLITLDSFTSKDLR